MEASEDRLRLEHMSDAAAKAVRFVGSKPLDEFMGEEILYMAVQYLLSVIGEAASRVSVACRDAHPEIPWADIVGMRNRIIHGYATVNLTIVWQTVTDDLGPLQQSLKPLLVPG